MHCEDSSKQKWGVLPGQESGPPGLCLRKGRAGNPSSSSFTGQDRSERGQGPYRYREEQRAEVLTLTQAGERERREEVGTSGRRQEWQLLGDAGHTIILRPLSMAPFVSLQIFKVGIFQIGKPMLCSEITCPGSHAACC